MYEHGLVDNVHLHRHLVTPQCTIGPQTEALNVALMSSAPCTERPLCSKLLSGLLAAPRAGLQAQQTGALGGCPHREVQKTCVEVSGVEDLDVSLQVLMPVGGDFWNLGRSCSKVRHSNPHMRAAKMHTWAKQTSSNCVMKACALLATAHMGTHRRCACLDGSQALTRASMEVPQLALSNHQVLEAAYSRVRVILPLFLALLHRHYISMYGSVPAMLRSTTAVVPCLHSTFCLQLCRRTELGCQPDPAHLFAGACI